LLLLPFSFSSSSFYIVVVVVVVSPFHWEPFVGWLDGIWRKVEISLVLNPK
jgi:hypothetical protein